MNTMTILLYSISILVLFIYSYFAINYAANLFNRRKKNILAFIILSILNTAYIFIGNHIEVPLYLTYSSGIFILAIQFYFFVIKNFIKSLLGASIFIFHLICIQMFTMSMMSIFLNRQPYDMIDNFELFIYNILITFSLAILALMILKKIHPNEEIRYISQDKQQSILVSIIAIYIVFYSCFDSFAYNSPGSYSNLPVTMIAIQILSISLFYLMLAHSIKVGKMNHYKDKLSDIKVELRETKKNEQALKELAYRDHLTGSYSKNYASQYLSKLVDRKEIGYCVVYIDLDELKFINDTYGHDEGDNCIKYVSANITNVFREEDMFARIGGDEFLLIVENCNEKVVLSKMKEVQSILNAYTHEENDHPISISFGVTYVDSEKSALTQRELLNEVDKKMYFHKQNKKEDKNTEEVVI